MKNVKKSPVATDCTNQIFVTFMNSRWLLPVPLQWSSLPKRLGDQPASSSVFKHSLAFCPATWEICRKFQRIGAVIIDNMFWGKLGPLGFYDNLGSFIIACCHTVAKVTEGGFRLLFTWTHPDERSLVGDLGQQRVWWTIKIPLKLQMVSTCVNKNQNMKTARYLDASLRKFQVKFRDMLTLEPEDCCVPWFHFVNLDKLSHLGCLAEEHQVDLVISDAQYLPLRKADQPGPDPALETGLIRLGRC